MGQIRKHGGNIKEASEKYNLPEEEFIDFSANINPLGPPLEVLEALREKIELITRYPDSRNVGIRNSIADHLDILETNILMGNGASELIFLILNYYQPQNVWIPVPTFSEYEIAAEGVRAKIHHLPLQGATFSELNTQKLRQMQPGDIIFICNPNNPTGQLYSKQLLKEICNITKEKNAFLVIDESFLDFMENASEISFIKQAPIEEHIIILYSLTKFFAVPGLRLGAMISNENIIKKLDKVRDPWNINVLAQLAGEIALKNKEYIKQTLQFFQQEKVFLYKKLQEFDKLIPLQPSANYILIKLLEPLDALKLTTDLAQHGILVRNCDSYPLLGNEYIRVAIKGRKDNLKLIEKLNFLINL